ncbi:hypothetical protein ACFX2H_018803 [Malus domestica]
MRVGWATRVGCLACGACRCEAWAWLGNALGSCWIWAAQANLPWAWSDMTWVVALLSWALDGTESLDDTAWAVVVAPWTSSWVATMVATVVVAMVEPCGGGAALLIVTFSLVDCRGPIS